MVRLPAVAALALLSLLVTVSHCAAAKTRLHGSGATTLAKVFGAVIPALNRAHNVAISYNATGSGVGRTQFIRNKVDFAASDVPFTNAEEGEMKKLVKHTLTYSLETISIFVNIPGYTGGFNMTAELAVLIFSGQITKWSDARIKAVNPKYTFAKNLLIYVVHRADSSGTTSIFTKWLNKRPAWKLGEGGVITWPKKSNFLAAQGSERLASTMKGTPFSMGYLGTGIGLALKLNLNEAYLKNTAGKFLRASRADVYSAVPNPLPASTAPWTGVSLSLLDHAGASTYPIVTFTYLFDRKDARSLGNTGGLLKAFLKYLQSPAGQAYATKFFLNALPAKIVTQNKNAISSIVLAKGVKVPF